MSFPLTPCQKTAAYEISDWFQHSGKQTFMLTGYAGTGKTTLLKYLIDDVFKFNSDEVAIITPTGKAASVLIRKGLSATTLHRFMYVPELIKEMVVNQLGALVVAEKLKFVKLPCIDKHIKLIVLDEASMVSDAMLKDLLSFNVKVLLCGDDAQLPPVEGFNSFILKPDCTLTTIVRQAADNPIIQLADLCRQGKDLPFGNWKNVAAVLHSRDFTGSKRAKLLTSATQIICGTNRTRAIINEEVRAHLEYNSPLVECEKLICVRNNWEEHINSSYSFVNGMIGYAHNIEDTEVKNIGRLCFEPDFVLGTNSPAMIFDRGYLLTGDMTYSNHRQGYVESDGIVTKVHHPLLFDYGYCISAHKSQGSEFNNVVVFDESWCFKDDKYRWLYTALTRAKNRLVLLR